MAAATGLGTLGCSLHRYALPVVRRPSQHFFFNIHRASSHVCSTRSICSLRCHNTSLNGPDNLTLSDYMHKHRSDGVSSIVVDQPNLVPLGGTAASSQHIVHRLTVTFGYQKNGCDSRIAVTDVARLPRYSTISRPNPLRASEYLRNRARRMRRKRVTILSLTCTSILSP